MAVLHGGRFLTLFYPGYGDTWPMFNGAIGMTYEQAGSGRAGLGIVTAEGDTLTLADRIEHHYTTSLSTIEVAANERDRIIDQFTQYFHDSATGPTGAHAAYLIRQGRTGRSGPHNLKPPGPAWNHVRVRRHGWQRKRICLPHRGPGRTTG